MLPRPYEYPGEPHRRKHGPEGFSNYARYRPWLRDEFAFRCVFCLTRERWVDLRRPLQIDHFEPKALRPERENDYENLLLLCAACNSLKSTSHVPDPCEVALSSCLKIHDDGSIVALNEYGERLILELALDDPEFTAWRRQLLTMLKVRAEVRSEEYARWMSFPDSLPDLSRLRPRRNRRPEGVESCWYALRARGQLPPTY
jgi:hypothetical protein